MKKQRSLAIVLTLILALSLFAGCTSKSKDKLIVGMELAYPPFETTGTDNSPQGLSVDLATEIAKALGKELVIENIAWTGLIPALETGKVDLVISSMTITEERKKTIDFSDPYASIGLALLINRDSPVQNYEDLKEPGRILAVKKGTSGHLYAVDHLPSENTMVFEKESTCVLEVIQGKADAFTYDQLTILRQWQQNEEETRVNLEPYQDELEYWGIGVKKGSDELVKQINEFLEDFQKKDGFEKLAEKHLKDEKESFEEFGIPFMFDIK